MPDLTVAPSGTHLLRDGRPFPLVADTAWSAFADARLEDWGRYLNLRRNQGFTSVAVSALPILHDRTVRPGAREPFTVSAMGTYNFDEPDPLYWETAQMMARMAAEHDITLLVVVLWCNYVPGSWAAAITPDAVMTSTQRRAHVSRTVQAFINFDPIFVISGDEHFVEPEPVQIYFEVLRQVASEAPRALRTMHSTPTADLPPSIADSTLLDFYTYQSGHVMATQNLCIDLAAMYLAKPVRRPIVNLEPAYEGGGRAGRLGAADVRRGMWWSLLSGAAAGIGYGANGIWQWHEHGGLFTNPTPEPFSWDIALTFDGADDVAFASSVILEKTLFDKLPAQELLVEAPDGFRVLSSRDRSTIVIYLPYALVVTLDLDLTAYALQAFALDERRRVYPSIVVREGRTIVAQCDVAGDMLLLFDTQNRES
jgi:hypothetical protein